MPRDRRDDDSERNERPRPKQRRYGGFGEQRDKPGFLPQQVRRPERGRPQERPPVGGGRPMGMAKPRPQRAPIRTPADRGQMVGNSPEVQRAMRDQQGYQQGIREGTRDPLRVLPGSMQLLDFMPQVQSATTPLADIGLFPSTIGVQAQPEEEFMIPPIRRPRQLVTGSRIPR